MKENYFATFGSGNLENFDANPMKVMLVHESESRLRDILQSKPFNNKYCTTYDIKYAKDMEEKYGMQKFTLDELFEKFKLD